MNALLSVSVTKRKEKEKVGVLAFSKQINGYNHVSLLSSFSLCLVNSNYGQSSLVSLSSRSTPSMCILSCQCHIQKKKRKKRNHCIIRGNLLQYFGRLSWQYLIRSFIHVGWLIIRAFVNKSILGDWVQKQF